MEPFVLTSTTFEASGMIPIECTCDGDDRSPGLQWAGVPGGTQSFVLIVDDPDAPKGTFTHWVRFDIAGEVLALDEGQPLAGIDGSNDFQQTGYGGPCPPEGDRPHGYRFTLYALDVPSLNLKPGATRREVEDAMQGHELGRTHMRGRYERHPRRPRHVQA